MISGSILVVLISAVVSIGMMLALVRFAYLAGRAEANKLLAEEKQKRMEHAARAVQQFDANYADLTDEDLKHRLRNL